jgi:hypothetical protein
MTLGSLRASLPMSLTSQLSLNYVMEMLQFWNARECVWSTYLAVFITIAMIAMKDKKDSSTLSKQ